MHVRKIPPNLICGLDLAGEVLYGKWKPRLLWFIDQGHLRPAALRRKIPAASARVLRQQLRELERHGLVSAKPGVGGRSSVEYRLTTLGRTALPVIAALGAWGDAHQERLRDAIAADLVEPADPRLSAR